MSVVSVTGGVRAGQRPESPTAKVKAKAKRLRNRNRNRNRNRRIHPLAAVFLAVAIAHAIARSRKARIAAAVESEEAFDEFGPSCKSSATREGRRDARGDADAVDESDV